MKLITPDTNVGRFFVGVRDRKVLDLIGSTSGFDTYEDALAQLRKHKPLAGQEDFLILQAVGQFKVHPQYVEVHSS